MVKNCFLTVLYLCSRYNTASTTLTWLSVELGATEGHRVSCWWRRYLIKPATGAGRSVNMGWALCTSEYNLSCHLEKSLCSPFHLLIKSKIHFTNATCHYGA